MFHAFVYNLPIIQWTWSQAKGARSTAKCDDGETRARAIGAWVWATIFTLHNTFFSSFSAWNGYVILEMGRQWIQNWIEHNFHNKSIWRWVCERSFRQYFFFRFFFYFCAQVFVQVLKNFQCEIIKIEETTNIFEWRKRKFIQKNFMYILFFYSLFAKVLQSKFR